MANVDRPHGFPPVDAWDGSNFPTRTMIKALADTTAVGIGDLVDISGAADTIVQGALGGPFVGVAMSFGAASTLTTHPVIRLTAGTILEGQDDGDTNLIAAAGEGLNASIVVAAANSTTGLSGMEIDSSTEANTSTLDLNLLRPAPRVGNTVGSSFADWFVRVNDLRWSDLKAGL